MRGEAFEADGIELCGGGVEERGEFFAKLGGDGFFESEGEGNGIGCQLVPSGADVVGDLPEPAFQDGDGNLHFGEFAPQLGSIFEGVRLEKAFLVCGGCVVIGAGFGEQFPAIFEVVDGIGDGADESGDECADWFFHVFDFGF